MNAADDDIPFSDNDLTVNYALSVYGQEIEYQTRLNDSEWSKKTKATEHTLFNLKEGKHVSKIRTKYNDDFKESSFNFIIKSPLYETFEHTFYIYY